MAKDLHGGESNGAIAYPLLTRGDLDGFFGLMVDNLVQVLMIVALCTTVAGLPSSLVYDRILPGVAVSLLIGNLFYAWQARRVARRDGNFTCTALPYGINTPSLFAFTLFIMAPVYRTALGRGESAVDAGELAWRAGLVACLVSGLVEFGSAFIAEHVRRITPRAALLGVLAALGITFIAADFAFRIFAQPLVAIVPMAIILLVYFGKYRLPFRLPGGLVAVAIGTLVAWGISSPTYLNWFGGEPLFASGSVGKAVSQVGWRPPHFCGRELLSMFAHPEHAVVYLTISIPMGLINALGSLQNIESAEAAGDRFRTKRSLAVNGVGTLAAGLFGSCFPTTIYIGHPGWKAMGARSAYSVFNGVFFTVCFFFGLGPLLVAVIPVAAGAPIVMWIGIIITAQAFQTTPSRHAPAVAIALFPAVAAILLTYLPLFLTDGGAAHTMAQMLTLDAGQRAVPTMPGMMALMGANQGWLMTGLILSAMSACLIDRRFRAAGTWCMTAAILTLLGLLHAYRLEGNEVRELFIWQSAGATPGTVAYRAIPIAVGYALSAIFFLLMARVSGATKATTHTE